MGLLQALGRPFEEINPKSQQTARRLEKTIRIYCTRNALKALDLVFGFVDSRARFVHHADRPSASTSLLSKLQKICWKYRSELMESLEVLAELTGPDTKPLSASQSHSDESTALRTAAVEAPGRTVEVGEPPFASPSPHELRNGTL